MIRILSVDPRIVVTFDEAISDDLVLYSTFDVAEVESPITVSDCRIVDGRNLRLAISGSATKRAAKKASRG